MTNAEKFKEVFGFSMNTDLCQAPYPVEVCPDIECKDCGWNTWHNQEYTGKLPEYSEEVST